MLRDGRAARALLSMRLGASSSNEDVTTTKAGPMNTDVWKSAMLMRIFPRSADMGPCFRGDDNRSTERTAILRHLSSAMLQVPRVCGLAAALTSIAATSPAWPQGAADFYRGKTINLIAGFNPGGGADTYARHHRTPSRHGMLPATRP